MVVFDGDNSFSVLRRSAFIFIRLIKKKMNEFRCAMTANKCNKLKHDDVFSQDVDKFNFPST